MKTFKLQIAAPDGLIYDGEAVQLSVRGIAGDLAVMAGHIPFVTALADGDSRVYLGDGTVKRATRAAECLWSQKSAFVSWHSTSSGRNNFNAR